MEPLPYLTCGGKVMHCGNLMPHFADQIMVEQDHRQAELQGFRPYYTSVGWYWYDETEQAVGPFPTYEVAREAQSKYEP